MRFELIAADDSAAHAECYELFLAALKADDPLGRATPMSIFRIWMTTGWMGQPREVWTVRDGGILAAWCLLQLPDKENKHRGSLDVVVHPSARRRGTGRALLAHASERAAAAGRTVLAGSAWQGSAGDAFARTAGATPTLTDIRRVQVLADLKPDALSRLRDQARQAAAGYSIVTWTGPVPERYIEPMLAVLDGFEDAPRPESADRVTLDAERIREDNERFIRNGLRGYTVAARHDATGNLAAATEVDVPPDDPEWASQGFTAVVREHRGHQLGLLTKIAMLDWLAEAEPRVTHIETWNAEVNSHMIKVNEALGYQILGAPSQGYELTLAR